jgi:hypothetical protein
VAPRKKPHSAVVDHPSLNHVCYCIGWSLGALVEHLEGEQSLGLYTSEEHWIGFGLLACVPQSGSLGTIPNREKWPQSLGPHVSRPSKS